MRRRRLPFQTVNIVAVAAVVGSAFLPWWNGLEPYRTDFLRLLSKDVIDPTDWIFMSIAMVIFVGAGVMLLGGLLASKILILLGTAIEIAVVVAWLFMSGVLPTPIEQLDFKIFQPGSWLVAGGVLLSLISLFMPRHHREK
jgi:hypothetical protein